MRYILQDVVIVAAAVVCAATVTALYVVAAVMFGTVLRTLRFVGILLPI